jgi:hypothetical protein
MGFIWSILEEMGRVLADTVTSPSFLLIYMLLFGLVAWQYRRLQSMSAAVLQVNKNAYLRSALVSTLFGILGGFFGSVLLVILGVDLEGLGLSQLWLVAVFLMLIKPRFLCFAYAAGVLSISNLLFSYPHINIPQLMGLVAVLHMVESLLILLNGRFSPSPVYIKKKGQLRGGFNLQLFWPLPLIVLLGVGFASPTGDSLPTWWPLIQDFNKYTPSQTYTLLPVLAVLGYGEISTTRTPMQTIRKSSLYLFLFSLSLLLLSILASRQDFLLPAVALFSPLGHELVIWLGMRAENRKPIYLPPERGVMILDVVPGKSAHRAGLRSHDVILTVNGQVVNQYSALQELLKGGWQEMIVEIKRGANVLTLPVRTPPHSDLGIIPVPDHAASHYLSISEDNIFTIVRQIWRRIRK